MNFGRNIMIIKNQKKKYKLNFITIYFSTQNFLDNIPQVTPKLLFSIIVNNI